MLRILIVALVGFVSLAAQETTIFVGKPLVRVSASEAEAVRDVLSDGESVEYACRIVRRGNKYLWASREYRELTMVRSPASLWIYFIATKRQVRRLHRDDDSHPHQCHVLGPAGHTQTCPGARAALKERTA